MKPPTKSGTAGWATLILVVIFTTFVVGIGAVDFQLFGDSPDSTDYEISGGGYLGGTIVLFVALAGLFLRRKPIWLKILASSFIIWFLVFMGCSFETAAGMEQQSNPHNSFLDGLGGVTLMPWSLYLMGMTVYFCCRPESWRKVKG